MATNKVRKDPPSPQPYSPTLGGKIYALVQARGLSMSAAAEMAGMTRQQLWRIIQGDVGNPGILTIQTVVRSLGGRMKDLFIDGDLVAGGPPDKAENGP